MFRIKTDIRHYRCDSRDKVERLIRNWVIRPTDQIYDADQDDWSPIGDHPSFVALFDELAERHDNQPKTVVTPEIADKAAADRSAQPDHLDSPGANNTGSAPLSAILRRPPQKAPPNPSDEVVGLIRDSDEITMMTEKTLDLLRDDAPPAAKAGQAADDEPTQITERPDFDDDLDGPDSPGSTRIVVADVEPSPEERAPQEDQKPSADAQPPHDSPSAKPQRHSLPEELFATAEFDAQKRETHEAPLDELKSLESEQSDGEDDVDDLALQDTIEREPLDRDDLKAPKETDLKEDHPTKADPAAPKKKSTRSKADPLCDTLDIVVPDIDDDADDDDIDGAEPFDFEVDDEAFEDAFEDIEQSAGVADHPPDETAEHEHIEEISVAALTPDDGIRLGYDVDLPFPIAPSPQALKSGIQTTDKQKALGDKLYPLPEPKQPGQIQLRLFDLSAGAASSALPLTKRHLAITGVVLLTISLVAGVNIAAC